MCWVAQTGFRTEGSYPDVDDSLPYRYAQGYETLHLDWLASQAFLLQQKFSIFKPAGVSFCIMIYPSFASTDLSVKAERKAHFADYESEVLQCLCHLKYIVYGSTHWSQPALLPNWFNLSQKMVTSSWHQMAGYGCGFVAFSPGGLYVLLLTLFIFDDEAMTVAATLASLFL